MPNIQQWKHKRLTELADYINGYAFKPEDWGEAGLPIIRIEQLRNPETISDYYSGLVDNKFIIHNGDLIFSWSASIFVRIWTYGTAILNQHLFKVAEKGGVDRKFLKQIIEYHIPELIKKSHGSTMQHITRRELERLICYFPICKIEQSKIADILSKVDRAIEQTEALIAKQQRIKNGLMQNLLTKGIDDNGNLRSEETHEFKDSPLGRIPVEWDVITFCQIVESSAFGPRFPATSYSEDGNIAMIRTTDIDKHGNINYSTIPNAKLDIKLYINHILKKRDILITRSGTIGITSIYEYFSKPVIPGAFLIRFRLIKEKAYYKYWKIYFNSTKGQSRLIAQAEGGVQKNLRGSAVNQMLVACPSHNEQMRVIDVLDKHERLTNRSASTLKKLRSLKSALMQDLLTGKVRVTPLLDGGEAGV